MRKHWVLLFTIFNILLVVLLLHPTPHHLTSAQDNNDVTSNSLFIPHNNGDVSHIQVTSDNSTLIWRKNFGVIQKFQEIRVVDINSDGIEELLLVHPNDGVYLVNLQTGNLFWKYILPSNSGTLTGVDTGDVNGDHLKEILVTIVSPISQFDSSIFVIDSSGNLFHQFKTSDFAVSSYGADNGKIFDLDNDGLNEIILSYGSTLFNFSTYEGNYRLETWQWDSEISNFTQLSIYNGTDNGGNTNLITLEGSKNYLITSGWYNNPVRAFNETGSMFWERYLFNNTERLRLADSLLGSYTDSSNNQHLVVVTNNYWENETMYLFQIDPASGASSASPIDLGNISSVKLSIFDHFAIIIYRAEYEDGLRFEASIINLETGDIDPIQQPDGESWEFYVQSSSNSVPFVLLNGDAHLIVGDASNQLWFSNGITSYALTISIAELNMVFSYPDSNFIGGGLLLNEYNPVSQTGTSLNSILLLIFIILLLGIALIIFYFKYYLEWSFHRSFGNSWREAFVFRLLQTYQTNNHIKLPPKSQQIEYLSGKELISEKNDKLVSVSEGEENPKYRLDYLGGTDNNSTVYHFIHSNSQIATKVKVGDIALLIELLDHYPGDVDMKFISSKFSFTTTNTIYNRLNMLQEVGLLDKITHKITESGRTSSVTLTEMGLQFLSIFYKTLKDDHS